MVESRIASCIRQSCELKFASPRLGERHSQLCQISRSGAHHAKALSGRAYICVYEIAKIWILFGWNSILRKRDCLRRNKDPAAHRIFDVYFAEFRLDGSLVRQAFHAHARGQFQAIHAFHVERNANIQGKPARTGRNFGNSNTAEDQRLKEPAIASRCCGKISAKGKFLADLLAIVFSTGNGCLAERSLTHIVSHSFLKRFQDLTL